MGKSRAERRAEKLRRKALAQSTLLWWVNTAFLLAASVGCFYLAGSRQHFIIVLIGVAFFVMALQCARLARVRSKL